MKQQSSQRLVTYDHAIAYKIAGGKQLKYYVWKPEDFEASDRRAAIVFYHGGGWKQGTYTQFQKEACYFKARGLVVISVEYRVVGPVVATEDAIDAMNEMFKRASELGIDPLKVTVAGGSAGGQLALATALLDLPNLNQRNRPNAVMLDFPVTHTAGDYPDGYGLNWFESEKKAKRYSPYHHIQPGSPPTLIMHGTGDEVVSFQNSLNFHNKMVKSGNVCKLISYDGQKHGFARHDPNRYNPYNDESIRQMDLFLQELGYLTGPQSIKVDPQELTEFPDRKHIQDGLLGDVTSGLQNNGVGEYYFGAWLKADSAVRAALGLRIKGSSSPDQITYLLDAVVIPADRFVFASGTKKIFWEGTLQEAALILKSDREAPNYVTEPTLQFLHANE